MSQLQADGQRNLKRPRGLLASRKKAGAPTEPGPGNKKPRPNDPPAEIDQNTLNAQDWSDLKELFENALDGFYGRNQATALPLIRGVLHECARLVTVHKDPAVIYSPIEDAELPASSEPASAFYTIYASAWLLMSTVACTDASVLTDDEPTEPMVYMMSALAACEEGKKALDVRGQGRVWDLEFAWGRALVGVVQLQANPEKDDGNPQPPTEPSSSFCTNVAQLAGQDPLSLLPRVVDHLSYAIENYPMDRAAAETEEGKMTRDERFVRSALDAAQSVLGAAEQVRQGSKNFDSNNYDQGNKLLHSSQNLFSLLAQTSNLPMDVHAQALLGKAQAGLAIGAAIAEAMEDDERDDTVGNQPETHLREEAIKYLRGAIEQFSEVRNLSFEAGDKLRVDEEEVKPLMQEALVTLATLLPEGPEQEAMYARYKEEGGVLEVDEGDEDDTGDEN